MPKEKSDMRIKKSVLKFYKSLAKGGIGFSMSVAGETISKSPEEVAEIAKIKYKDIKDA